MRLGTLSFGHVDTARASPHNHVDVEVSQLRQPNRYAEHV